MKALKIIVDAMGGDFAPKEIVKGAVDAQREFGVEIVFTGRRADVERELASCGVKAGDPSFSIVDCSDVIEMCDDPSTAVRRKPDSSMAKALHMLKDGEGDACVSAGSTGALLTGATLVTKRIRGIRRAAMCPVFPNGGKGALIIDCGANAECTAEYLLQFAYMGSFYAERVMHVERPRVGLLNIGSEENKGTELRKEVFSLLKAASEEGRINFIGNIESNAVFSNNVDVVVSDGFTGNIFIKTMEGMSSFLLKQIKNVIMSSAKGKIAGALIQNDIKELRRSFSSEEVGGTPMLGISKPVIKAHGNSNARAIRSAIKQAIACVENDVCGAIADNISFMKVDSASGKED